MRRSTHHQLGFALQMCTVRYIGRFHRNLNLLGRYSFTASPPAGVLRPLRDPDAPELDEDETGWE